MCVFLYLDEPDIYVCGYVVDNHWENIYTVQYTFCVPQLYTVQKITYEIHFSEDLLSDELMTFTWVGF